MGVSDSGSQGGQHPYHVGMGGHARLPADGGVGLPTDDLHLLGPYDAWHGAAHRGRLVQRDGTTREVRVLLGPETTSADAVQRARDNAAFALRLRHPAVVPLLDVRQFAERIAWVYDTVDGVGLGHTLGRGEDALLSTRAVAEVIARVAEVLLEIGPEAFSHSGPEAADLILDAAGRLWIAGFASPFPRSPAMRAPMGDEGEAAAVYRLGVLLAHLVSGSAPGLASDRGAHAAVIRRALIRAMSRPGPVLSERYGDWLRGLLAWEPTERPALSTVPAGLRGVAEGTAGPDLAQWAARRVEPLRRQVERAAEERRGGGEGTVLGRSALERGLEGDEIDSEAMHRRVAIPPSVPPAEDRSALPEKDDDTVADEPTQEAGDEPEVVDSKPPIRVTSLLPIPVQVGPPPEAVRTRPSLPPGFLDDGTDPNAPVSRLRNPFFNPRVLWMAGVMLGLVAVALLVINLVLWGRQGSSDPVEAPHHSIGEVLGEGGASTGPAGGFTVTAVGPEEARLELRCGSKNAAGVGQVALEGVVAGDCEVTGLMQDTRLATSVPVVGPATLVCFDGGRPRCR